MQERLRSFRGEKPRAGTTRWQTEVLNQEFDATYRRNHRDIFNTLGNEYGWEFLEQVLQFHYLRDGSAIAKRNIQALSGTKPTQGCQVSGLDAPGQRSPGAGTGTCLNSRTNYVCIYRCGCSLLCRSCRT